MNIVLECASWYKREDGLIQIINAKGKNNILNPRYTKIWELINNEIAKSDLIQCIEDEMESTELEIILQDLQNAELISIYDENEEFARLFG